MSSNQTQSKSVQMEPIDAESGPVKPGTTKTGLQTRHAILFLCMMINGISYSMRTSLNLTIVAMVKEDENVPSSETCLDQSNASLIGQFSWKYDQEQLPNEDFNWSESLQGTIIGAFYYGYIITMAFGGQLADLVGTKKLISLAILVSSLCTLVIPVSAYLHPYLVVAVRVLTGMSQGVITPALYTIIPRWMPNSEMGVAFGLVHAFGNVGSVVTMPICAYLSEYGFAGGWPSVFYCFGAVGLLALVPWFYFVHNSPDVHPRISAHELGYIKSNQSITTDSQEHKKSSVPWKSILTSPKIWTISVTRFCGAWGNLFLMSKLPAYLKTILHMPITYNGYVNASIYIAFGSSLLIWGYVSDLVDRRQLFSRTVQRKLFQSLALFGGAFFLGIIPLVECNVIAIIVLLNLSMITLGLTAGGESLIVVDVAPDYAGSVYGITNAVASLPGILAPLFVGVLLDQSTSENYMKQWNTLFWVGSGIYAFGAFLFIVGVNSEPEKWGKRPLECKSNATESKDYSTRK